MGKSTKQSNLHSGTRDLLSKIVLIILSIFCGANAKADTVDASQSWQTQNLFTVSLEELLEIPVKSASFLPENSHMSASTTSTVTRQSWQSRNARRISDAVEFLPGTQVLPFRFGAEAIALRGYSGSNLPRGVSVRWDGVPLSGFSNGSAVVSVPNINLNVLEKIEMVRGPASALYGSDAFHGVLSLYSVDRIPAAIQTTVSSDDYYDFSGHFALPSHQSVRTVLAASASGQGDQQQAYHYTDATSGDQSTGYRKNQYASQTALINVTSTEQTPISFRLGLYWNQFDGDRFAGAGRSQTPGISALGNQDWSGSNTEFTMANAMVNVDLRAGISVELNTYIWIADIMQETKVPRMPAGIGENRVNIGDVRYGTSVIFRQNQSGNNTNWALSFGHDTLKVDQGHTTMLTEDNTILAEIDERFADKERYISNLTLEAKTSLLKDKLKLVYGGRIDQYNDFGTHKTPRLGVIFFPEARWTYKLLYGEAFRAPTAFEMYGIGNFQGNPDLKPETVNTLEWVVTRSANRWTTGITFFTSRWQNSIIRVPSEDPDYRLEFRNVDENRSHGVEAHYQFQSQRWLADLSASWVKSENVTQDKEYLAFPRIMFNAGLGYLTESGTQITLSNRVHIYASPGLSSEPQNDPLDAFWRVDFSILKELGRQAKLNFGVRNLFNRDNVHPSLFNAENGIPADELSVNIGLNYQL